MSDPREHIWPKTFLKYHAICRFWALSLNGEESLQKLTDPDPDLDLHKNRSNSSSYTQHVYQVSSESVFNILRYFAKYPFWPDLSMVRNHLKNSSRRIRIRIFTKFDSVRHCRTLNASTKFHFDPPTTFWDILYTDKQTNRQKGIDKQKERQTDRKQSSFNFNISSFNFGGGGN